MIEFLTAEDEMPIRIHERLKNVYGDATVDVSTVADGFVAVKKLKDKQGWLTKRGVAGRLATAFYRAGIRGIFLVWIFNSNVFLILIYNLFYMLIAIKIKACTHKLNQRCQYVSCN